MISMFTRGSGLIVTFAVAAMLVAVSPFSPVFRTLFALPLVLFLPGHALLRLGLSGHVGRLEYLTFAVGLSIATTLLAGLLLHVVDAMTPLGWALLLGGITIGAAAWDMRFPNADPVQLNLSGALSMTRAQVSTIACSFVCLLAALLIALHGAAADCKFFATALWLVPKADNVATLGIKNTEGEPVTYDVELKFDGRIADVRRSINLRPEQSWTDDVEVPVRAGGVSRVEAWLYRDGDHSTVYRRVWIAAHRIY